MLWKCKSCAMEIELPDGTSIHFCPSCGAAFGNPPEADAPPAKCVDENAASTDSEHHNASQCPVCYSEIVPGDETITCPHCQIVYHKDCWEGNKGCATYGCPSAGCLEPPPMKIDLSDGTHNPTAPTPEDSSSNHPYFECPYCHTELAAETNFCWSCGKDISDISKSVETNGFDFHKLGKLSKALKYTGVSTLLLVIIIKIIDSMSKTYSEIITNPTCAILVDLITIVAFGAAIATNIIWIVLWKSMKRSTASTITLAVILFGLLYKGVILGVLFLFATTAQVDKIIKNKGRVQITFWGVKPIK